MSSGGEVRIDIDELATWLDAQLQRIPGKSDLAGAIRYARMRWPALTAYVDHGQLEISNNAAENAIRPATPEACAPRSYTVELKV